MKLKLDGAKALENPGDGEIASALASVDRGDSDVVILDQTELTYIQAYRDIKLGLVVEYQNGSLFEHFRSTDHMVALDRATYTFQKYAKGDLSWQGEIRWGKVPSRELIPTGPSGAHRQPRDANHSGDWVEGLAATKPSKASVAGVGGDVRFKNMGEPYAWEKQHRRREAWRGAVPENIPLWFYAVAVIFAVLFVAIGGKAVKGLANSIFAQTRDPNTSNDTMAYIQCEDAVRESLKAPSSAEFSGFFGSEVIVQGDRRYAIIGWVDAENSFGAKIRTKYICKTRDEGNGRWSFEPLMVNSGE